MNVSPEDHDTERPHVVRTVSQPAQAEAVEGHATHCLAVVNTNAAKGDVTNGKSN